MLATILERPYSEPFDTAVPSEGAWTVQPDGVIAADSATKQQQEVLAARAKRWGGTGEVPAAARARRIAALVSHFASRTSKREQEGSQDATPATEPTPTPADASGSPPPAFFKERVVEFGKPFTRQQWAEAAASRAKALAAQATELGWTVWPKDRKWPEVDLDAAQKAGREAFLSRMKQRHGSSRGIK